MRITPAYAGKRYNLSRHLLWTRDHPRVCGEKVLCAVVGCAVMGSPPRMRGKDDGAPMLAPEIGITPAYAGKSIIIKTARGRAGGSPPRMRGKESNARRKGQKNGITPAYAGKSPWRIFDFSHKVGSPPRMRGKVVGCVELLLLLGITPAYAGKSLPVGLRSMSGRDHPRVCGEKVVLFILYHHYIGSPPRMRGKEVVFIDDYLVSRITPAYAGKSEILCCDKV